jgi:hypothetical protein
MIARIFSIAALLAGGPAAVAAADVDLTNATLVIAGTTTTVHQKTAEMLVEEVERRTGARWKSASSLSGVSGPAVVVGLKAAVAAMLPEAAKSAAPGAEGFSNGLATRSATVYIAGTDARGMLFGAGHLLRHLEMTPGKALLPSDYAITTAPEYRLRGHQLGYRPKTNSYDGWTIPMWRQYVRDLVVFGANAIELIPPRSDDDPDSPHFPQPQIDTMIAMSQLLDEYDLDVWVWYPAMDDDYSDLKTVEFALKEWGDVFRRLPRVDAVLVPAGDPGHTPAPILMPFLEKQAANLRKYHPRAQLWIAPQGFDEKSLGYFFDAVDKRPAWLAGIVYGPQTRISLPDLRRRLPKDMPIRHYPDITHTRQSQYPVPDWDAAFALTSGREPVNPRPLDQATIFRTQQPHTIGFITYSEGCNDDVNKALWSALGWNQEAAVFEALLEYSRYFIGPEFANDLAHGLMGLERNWRGRVLTNNGIDVVLGQFQAMERKAQPRHLANWRFQMALYRAYYDAYVRGRLIGETAAEARAVQALNSASNIGSEAAMSDAEAILDAAAQGSGDRTLRTRVFQLAEALFQSVRMQTSVPLYRAIAGRGNTLDTVDFPLNNRLWLKDEFARIRKVDGENDRLEALQRVVRWEDPGPGGFYDDLGKPGQQPHLVSGAGFSEDPQFFKTPQVFIDARGRGRTSWWDQIIGLYEHPIQLKYDRLDPEAQYRVRVVYGAGPVRLEANGKHEIHGYVNQPLQVSEFDIPQEETASGSLTLQWNRPPGGGGAGRGCQIAEVWLLKR